MVKSKALPVLGDPEHHTELRQRRSSAHLWSLCLSRSIKVTNFGTNRKPICNFLLVINTNLHPITVFKLLQITGQICAFDKGYLSLTLSFG